MTILKRFLKALTCAFLLLTLPAKIVCASDEVSLHTNTWDISATEDDSVSASLYELPCGEFSLEIIGRGKMKNFSDLTPSPWFQYADRIVFVRIGAEVENIGRFTFNTCFALQKIYVEGMSVTLPADIFPIPDETEIYAHFNSDIADYVLTFNPDSFYPLCKFNNSVCTVCYYRCADHKGGEATCTSGAVCEICGTEYEGKTGHSLGDIIAETPSDCTNEGMRAYYICSRCGLLFDSEENPTTEEQLAIPIKHQVGKLIPYLPPKCTEHGIVAHYHCDKCGANFDENNQPLYNIYLPATDHSGGVATCTSCAICDVCKIPYGALDANNHSFSESFAHDENSHWHECNCGEIKEREKHNLVSRITKPQTVDENGIKEYSCVCGYKYEETLPKLPQPPENPKQSELDENKTALIFIIAGVAVFVSAGVIFTVIIVKKRNSVV